MGEMRTLRHFVFAQVGFDLAFGLPVMMVQSVVKCLSIRILGSSPGGIEMTSLQSGPVIISPRFSIPPSPRHEKELHAQDGATRLNFVSSYFSQLWAFGK